MQNKIGMRHDKPGFTTKPPTTTLPNQGPQLLLAKQMCVLDDQPHVVSTEPQTVPLKPGTHAKV